MKTIIAIDGPAASGKTTVGYKLADVLGYLFLDTGSMYRAVTLAVIKGGVDVNDERAVEALSRGLDISIEPAGNICDGRTYSVILDGTDVTWELRTADVDLHVSLVSSYPGVRKELVNKQRSIASQGRVVAVGRDIGTVVLPDAPIKLYIIASAEERARRRWRERLHRGGSLTYEEILADIVRRDGFDGSRVHAPMKPAKDAILIDTTGLTPDEVLSAILALDVFQDLQKS